MSKTKLIVLILGVCLLAACAPSQRAIQTAIAQTQAAIPPTVTLTSTALPTETINPCSDRGWEDISNYMIQFNIQEKNYEVGTSISAYLQSLINYQEKINSVVIDSCTEHARQLFIMALGNRIYAYQIIMTSGDNSTSVTPIIQAHQMIIDARAELTSLGIYITLP
jgi:hypothetical protein